MKPVHLFGAGPIMDTAFIRALPEGLLVACDGGYRHLQKEGVEPDILIGDFDTFPKDGIGKPKNLIVLNPIKDDTDTFSIIKSLVKEGYDTFHLYGCLGGRIDHTIANLQVLSYLKDNHCTGYLHSEDNAQVLLMIDGGESLALNPKARGMLSVFSYTDRSVGVRETNLKYTLEDYTMTSSIAIGISNAFLPQNTLAPTISLREGRLLLVLPSEALD